MVNSGLFQLRKCNGNASHCHQRLVTLSIYSIAPIPCLHSQTNLLTFLATGTWLLHNIFSPIFFPLSLAPLLLHSLFLPPRVLPACTRPNNHHNGGHNTNNKPRRLAPLISLLAAVVGDMRVVKDFIVVGGLRVLRNIRIIGVVRGSGRNAFGIAFWSNGWRWWGVGFGGVEARFEGGR